MIKGLGLSGKLMESGKIKIGIKGAEIKSAKGNMFRPPQKLDHFIITTTERDEGGDFVVDEELMTTLKDSGAGLINNKGDLIGIPIRLLYDDIERDFPTTLLSYVSGQLNCRGDGEVSFKAITKFEIETKCPCDRINPDYKGADKCKPFGTLTCFIDGVGLFGQAHKFRTTSANSVNGILGGMKLVSHTTNNRLAGLPLMLTLTAKTSIIPGTSTRTTIHVVSICYRGKMNELREIALTEHEDKQKYLTSITLTDDKDEKDIVEEFFPTARGEKKDQTQTIGSDTAKDVMPTSDPAKNKETKKSVKTGSEKGVSDTKKTTDTESGSKSILSALGFTPAYKKKIRPAGPNEKLYIELIEENDHKQAYKICRRLTRTDLLYFLIDQYPEVLTVDFDIKMKKPELQFFIKQELKRHLNDPGENNNNNIKKEEVKQAEKPNPPRSWDGSGEVTIDQLRQILKLKEDLEKAGVIEKSPAAWMKQVAYFLTQDAQLVKSAKELTVKQCNGLIAILTHSLPGDNTPF